MKIKILIIIIMILSSLILVSGESSYTFKKDTVVNLKLPCYNESYSLCPIGTTCNLTIFYPNNTVLADNQEMTFNTAYFNYTLDSSKTNILGEHSVSTVCYGSTNGFSTFNYEITLSGTKDPTEKSYILLGILILIFGIACVFLYLSGELTENGPKIFFLVLSFIFLLGSMAAAGVIAFDSNLTEGINGTITILIYVLGFVLFLVFAYVMIKETVAALDLYGLKKGYQTFEDKH